tara:strand:+ start:1171 stop:1923 length:753 start_codon:yes stop_codon:yes gene_type:complete
MAEGKLVLPTKVVKATNHNPKNLIVFSKPKVGKTSLLAQLENNLIVDFEEGSDYVDALKVKCNSIAEFKEVGNAIVEAGKPYKFLTLDTITALEEKCIPYAEELYSKSSMGKRWFSEGKAKYGNILNLANGAGYPWLRQAFEKVIAYARSLADHVILVGHVKDTLLEKNGEEFNASELDLTGKIKRITASHSDAIGYMYRKGNQNIISFKTTDEVSCGARSPHLSNKEIVVSEINKETGELTTYWERIFK